MSLNKEALAEATKALRISDVYFRQETVFVDPAVTPPFWPDCDKTQFKMVTRILHDFEVEGEGEEPSPGGAATPPRIRFLEIEFVGSVRCLAEQTQSDDEHELFSMEATLGLLYEVMMPCADESIEEFVRMNAPYHAIPYWREHVHAACMKRRFRPITVPMYTQALQRGEPKLRTEDAEG